MMHKLKRAPLGNFGYNSTRFQELEHIPDIPGPGKYIQNLLPIQEAELSDM